MVVFVIVGILFMAADFHDLFAVPVGAISEIHVQLSTVFTRLEAMCKLVDWEEISRGESSTAAQIDLIDIADLAAILGEEYSAIHDQ